jgi:hypothetical protein
VRWWLLIYGGMIMNLKEAFFKAVSEAIELWLRIFALVVFMLVISLPITIVVAFTSSIVYYIGSILYGVLLFCMISIMITMIINFVPFLEKLMQQINIRIGY